MQPYWSRMRNSSFMGNDWIPKSSPYGPPFTCYSWSVAFLQQSDGLFKDYIDTFLKIKQESSGFPEECDTEEKKQQHIFWTGGCSYGQK